MDVEEILNSPAFYILAGLGVGAEVLGWAMSKKAGWVVMPFWQLLVMIIVTLIASAFFATRE